MCLPSENLHKMLSFAYQETKLHTTTNHCKFFPAIIKNACSRCYGSCDQARASLSSEDEIPDTDLDNKHVIILAIQSRAMKAKARSEGVSSLYWVLSPTSGKLLIASKTQENEDDVDNDDDGADGETETFFSVKSNFSRCSIESIGSDAKFSRRRLILEELRHCEGWPFGLWRKAVVLPPLPSSPSDSWTWHKRNHLGRIWATF